MNALLTAVSIILAIYVTLRLLADLAGRCCYSEPSRKPCVASIKLWGDDLAATVSNPDLLKKAAIVKYVKTLESVTNIKLLARGEALYTPSSILKARLLIKLIRRYGLRKGFKAYRMFKLCVNPPGELSGESLYKFCTELLRWSEVLGCGGGGQEGFRGV